MEKRVIEAGQKSLLEYLKEIWNFRSLILVFAKRDIKVKYAQTLLGLGWTVLQPLTALAIFTFFFGSLLNWKEGDIPFSLYVLSGLLGWNFFTYIVFQGTSSIQESGELIKKIYFPKALLPLSKVLVALVELCISLLLLIPLLAWYGQMVSWRIIFFPIVLIFNALIALFLVFFTAALSYRVKDLFHLVPFMMYFGIWCTPVFFTKDILPEKINFVWYLNPMASVVEGWRWCLFSNWNFDPLFIPGLIIIIPLVFIGFSMYKKVERNFSDFV